MLPDNTPIRSNRYNEVHFYGPGNNALQKLPHT